MLRKSGDYNTEGSVYNCWLVLRGFFVNTGGSSLHKNRNEIFPTVIFLFFGYHVSIMADIFWWLKKTTLPVKSWRIFILGHTPHIGDSLFLKECCLTIGMFDCNAGIRDAGLWQVLLTFGIRGGGFLPSPLMPLINGNKYLITTHFLKTTTHRIHLTHIST